MRKTTEAIFNEKMTFVIIFEFPRGNDYISEEITREQINMIQRRPCSQDDENNLLFQHRMINTYGYA